MEQFSEGGAGPRPEFQTKKKLIAPKGDVGLLRDPEGAQFFRRKVKAAGKGWVSSKAIPWHGTTPMENDKGSGVRESPKDKVV